jgi:hypothetical protein
VIFHKSFRQNLVNLVIRLIKCKKINKPGYNTNFSQSVTPGLSLRQKTKRNNHLNVNSCKRKTSSENIQATKSTQNQTEDHDAKKKKSIFSNFINRVILKPVKNKQNLNEIQMNNNLKSMHISHKYIDGDDVNNEKDVLIFDKIENDDSNASKKKNCDLLDIGNDS